MLVSVSCTHLYRGITINFICKQPLEFYVDKLIVYVQLQRSAHCGWCTFRYGSGQESRQKKQGTQTSGKAKELGVSIITQSAVMKNALTALRYGTLPKQYISPNASHISSATGPKEFLGTECEYCAREIQASGLCDRSRLYRNWNSLSGIDSVFHLNVCDILALVK